MKRGVFLIMVLIICCGALRAQLKLPFDSAGGKIVYGERVLVKGAGKHQLYRASFDWVVLNYLPDNARVEINDSAAGYFKSICSFNDTFKFMEPHAGYEPAVYYYLAPTRVFYTLEIEVRPGECLLRLSGLHFKYSLPQNTLANASDTAVVVENSFENQYNLVLTKMTASAPQKKSWLSFFKSCDRRLRAVLRSYKKHIRNAGSDTGSAF